MKINEYINFANETPICYLATVENNQPRVRAIGFWYADESGFYFQTSFIKEFSNQLKQNPNTEVCFYKHESIIGTMMRVSGKVEFLHDKAIKAKAIEDRPFLKDFGLTPESPQLVIFKISKGEAHFWTMENNLKPKSINQFDMN